MLRSCYSTRMVFGNDPSVSARVRWYFCEPNAKPLGFPTTFVSRNYVDKGIWPDVGELEGSPRSWRNGSFPVVVDGQHGPCGPREIWDHGANEPNPAGLNRNDFGLAFCCEDQVDESGQPLFEIIPKAVLQQTAKHYFQAAIAARVTRWHSIVTILADLRTANHEINSMIALAGAVDHTFTASVAESQLVWHSVSTTLATANEVEHTFATVVAGKETTSHTFSAHLGQNVSLTHTFTALLCPSPGVFFAFDGDFGLWVAPPAVTDVDAFLWGHGGLGCPGTSTNHGGPGGGGGGFVMAFSSPVTPGLSYFYTLPTTLAPGFNTFVTDATLMIAQWGQPGMESSPGAGGFASGGDFAATGGDGGEAGNTILTNFGGGGGSAAGPAGTGLDGDPATLTSQGAGAEGVSGWFGGGMGGSFYGTSQALPGGFPGAGGGGAAVGPFSDTEAPWGSGFLIVTWQAAVHFFHSVLYRVGTAEHGFTAMIGTQGTVTHTISGLIAARTSATHTLSSQIAARISATHTLSSQIAARISATHTLSSQIAARTSATHTLKSVLASAITKTHTLKSVLASAITKTHTLKSEIWNNLLYDDFTGPNVALSSHTMNLGAGWTVDNIIGTASELAIFSSVFCGQNNTPQFQQAHANAGSANHTTEVIFEAGNSGGGILDLLVRYIDANNKLTCRINYSAAKTLTIYTVVAGVATAIGTVTCPALTGGNFYLAKVVTTATTVTLTMSGPGIATTTVGPITNSVNNTGTQFGFGIWRDDSANQFFIRVWQFRVY